MRIRSLHERLGCVAPSTLRAWVGEMRTIGVLGARMAATSHSVENELTDAGRDLIFVAEALGEWLTRSPKGTIAPYGPAAKGAIRALVGAWDGGLVRAFVEQPRTPAELSAAIDDHGSHAARERFAKLRTIGLVEPVGRQGRATRYGASEWLRHAVAPLIAADRWERLHLPDSTPDMSREDVEATFLLALPLVDLPCSLNGNCSLTVMTMAGELLRRRGGVAGVSVHAERGEILSRPAKPRSNPVSWALGGPVGWHNAVIDGDYGALRLSGAHPGLPRALVDGIRRCLFPRSTALARLSPRGASAL